MSSARPLVVVSLPGRTVEEVRNEVVAAKASGADAAEVRFDRWAPGERSRARELFPSPIPLLATLRSHAEGGAGPDEPAERAGDLLALARLPFQWIDLEADRDLLLEPKLPPPSALGRIVSSHLPEGAPTAEIARRLRGDGPSDAIRKVVVMASVGALLREILPALPPPEEGARVLHTTGPSGALLRAWAARLGFPLVYARLPPTRDGPAVAPIEASQIPADRLRYFLDGGASAPIFGIVGHPVAHSLSPYLHSRWMRGAGHRGLYVAFDIASESEFVDCIPALVDGGFRGINVTHPWKQVAVATASRVGRGAEVCGVANCLTFRDDDVEAENTDLVGILRQLEEYRRAGNWDGGELAVVGSGGAAAATLAAARELRASAFVIGRDPGRVVALAEAFGATPLTEDRARPFSLVVHATTVGRGDSGPLAAPLRALIAPGGRVLDWVYSPVDRIVASTAEEAGATYEDGWRLLVYQAAATFGVWWDSEPSSEAVAATLKEGPCTE